MKRGALLINVAAGTCALFLLGIMASITAAPHSVSLTSSSGSTALLGATLTSAQMTGLPPLSPEYPFDPLHEPGLPTLNVIVGAATTDAEALNHILAYYQTRHRPIKHRASGDQP